MRAYKIIVFAALPYYALAEEVIMLEPITVRNDDNHLQGAFAGLIANDAERPQTHTTLSAQQIADQQLPNLDNTLRQATGVSQQIWGSSRAGYNKLYARGALINRYLIDGQPVADSLVDTGNQSSLVYENVQVNRGVSGLLDGSGTPGVSVNMQRKLPEGEQRELMFGAGNRQHFALGADMSASLDRADILRTRWIANAMLTNGWRHREHEYNGEIYGVFDYQPHTQTNISAGIHYQRSKADDSASHSFIVYDTEGYPVPLGRKDNPASAWTYSANQSMNAFITLNQKWNDRWKSTFQYNYVRSHWDHPYGVAGVLSINHQDGSSDIVNGYWKNHRTLHSLSATLSGEYDLLGRQHRLVAGINGYHNDHNRPGERAGIGKIIHLNEFSQHGNYPKPDSYLQNLNQHYKQQQIGAYLASQLHLNDYSAVIIGARYTQFDYHNISPNNRSRSRGGKITPYLGLTIAIHPNTTLYAAYAHLFEPQTQKDKQDRVLAPSQGNSMEIGIKQSWYDEQLTASLSLYRNRQKNLAVRAGQHSDGSWYYRATNHSKSEGIEAELSGQLTPDWQIQLGYSYNRSQDDKGKRLNPDSIPHHAVKLYSSYQVNPEWRIGAGIRWQSETHSDINGRFSSEAAKSRAANTARQKSYSVVDLNAHYQPNQKFGIGLHLHNLFDQRYRTQPDRHSYGEPRSIFATLRYQF
ncbi:TonB-dependent siderophore receptor [Suttonella ornithocola]|uniref:Outer-membrane receptor for Fe(III)-coprogen, Fe(III)-ferrioxamine B and Fe(III)-rhodotrulic acid n=1 Tax=Suttonella ornithocola TaxID=279832 RepID=A0A380MSG9_9GAMM|nr:TonB-dependent siderophore receptor [Suttonella ornithocola]SUO94287.1 Outer-membrane receptor for Fe(III)-coprogen, Fe(III)-ferrioxamine B and Fe(III)-rhodotrulic acid [Suttonella ornithocola]